MITSLPAGNPIAFTSFVLGYHGCPRRTAEQVLSGEVTLSPSRNEYDWLGSGIYFWEHNPRRALEWAQSQRGNTKPAVLGAIIDLGRCLNLLDTENLALINVAFHDLRKRLKKAGQSLPTNRNPRSAPRKSDLLIRSLDCAVINHALNLAGKQNLPFDTVRAAFLEGQRLYPGSGLREKSHIQINVVNPDCILGYFRVQFEEPPASARRTTQARA
jgi:hypothetical protein